MEHYMNDTFHDKRGNLIDEDMWFQQGEKYSAPQKYSGRIVLPVNEPESVESSLLRLSYELDHQ
jgi:hypothetical protein